MRQSALVGSGLVIAAAACFGTLGYVARTADALGVGAFAFTFWRGVIGTASLVAVTVVLVAWQRGRLPDPRLLTRQQQVRLAVACAMGALLNLAIFVAFLRVEIAVALICFYAYPAIVTLAAVRFYGERLDPPRLGALVLASGGLVLVLIGPLLEANRIQLDLLGVALALTAAFCQAVYFLVAGRGFGPFSSLNVATYVVAAAGLAALPVALLAGEAAGIVLPLTDPAALPWVIVAGLVGAGVPTALLLVGISAIGPARSSILMTFEPVVGVVLAAFLLGEHPVPLQLVGGAAVLVAAAVLQGTPRVGALAVAEAEDEYQQLV